jgi:transcriptional regulator with XRE-family HTH domain
MAQSTKQTGRPTRGATLPKASRDEHVNLMRGKMEIVAARERGEQGVLGRVLANYPAHSAELAGFDAALLATTSYDAEMPTPAVDALAERALARAFAAVFPEQAAPAAAPSAIAASLQALRKARNLTPRALANRLGLGVDVLSSLERGLIKVATVPERLVRALGEALGASADQVHNVLQAQAVSLPAMLRSTEGQSKNAAPQPELDFARAVALSPNMSDDQKAKWLGE